MKKKLSNYIFAAALALCIFAVVANVGEQTTQDSQLSIAYVGNVATDPPFVERSVLDTDISDDFLCRRTQTSRTLPSINKTTFGQSSFNKLNQFLSQQDHWAFRHLKSEFKTVHSQKEKEGYYLFSLCKMRI